MDDEALTTIIGSSPRAGTGCFQQGSPDLILLEQGMHDDETLRKEGATETTVKAAATYFGRRCDPTLLEACREEGTVPRT